MDCATLSGLAAQILSQDVDLAIGFEALSAPGKFVVRSFSGIEELFDGYEITVDLVSDSDDLKLYDLLDTSASLGIYHKYDEPRFIHGQIAEIEKGQAGITRCYYRVVLKPALHRLNYHSDSRIFQNLSVVDISKTILQENGIVDTDWRVEFEHSVREYCVQYGETSLDFLKRIWAEEGLFFWFEHSASGHKMVISDAPLAMPILPNAQSITYNNMPGGTGKGSWISRFNQVERLRATNRVSRDYFFKRPAYHQQHSVGQYMPNGAKGNYELYHYPGRHKFPNAGQPFNDYALEAHRVEATTAEGETNNIQLSAGYIFALTDHPDEGANTNHRLLRVVHEGHQPAALQEEAPEDSATTYIAHFTSQPARLPYRPINPKPKTMVEGPQIAQVTGPEGEEIYCDEHGRCKIWFPWDRHGKKDEKSSCWVRVAQNWAGGTWGHMAIPRIGHEVVVDFLGGDPDQPLITGRTYHATNRPPYQLPANKTKMVIRSDTHKGKGFNEISFEDDNGKENIALHAQKDQTLKVLNNRMKRVDNDQVESVGTNKSIEVGNNHQERIGGSMNLTIGGGGSSLFATLAGIAGQAASEGLSVAAEAGNPLIPTFLSGVVAATAGGEAASGPKISDFDGAGNNRTAAGADQSAKGTALGALLSSVMPMSGVKNSIIEKIQSDTIGIARTEQIGAFKNTMVGAVQNTMVGAKQFTKVGNAQSTVVGKTKKTVVGEEYVIEVGKSKLIMKSDGTVILKGVRFNFEASGPVQVVGKVIDLN